MARPVIHAAVPEEVADWITRREELRQGDFPLSRAAMVELQIFHVIMTAELTRHRWSLAELEIIARSMKATPPALGLGSGVSVIVGTIFVAVYDARRLGEVADDETTAALLDKLGELSPVADMALAYAVADWKDQGLNHTAADWSTVGIFVSND